MTCETHTETTLICSCGYAAPLAALDLSRFEQRAWDQERLEGEWPFMTSTEREIYTELLESAKPFETKPLEAANVAVAKLLELRRSGAIQRAVDRAAGRAA